MGGGLLPVAMKENKLMFLFGEERKRPNESARGWADFGGGPEKNETNIETAAREGSEELCGFLGTPSKVRELLRGKKVVLKPKDIKYTSFLIPINYSDDIVKYFNNQVAFLNKYLPSNVINKSVIYEKERIKWFSIGDLKKERSKFRNFYRNMIDEIIKNEDKIRKLFTPKKKYTRKMRMKGGTYTKEEMNELREKGRKNNGKDLEKKEEAAVMNYLTDEVGKINEELRTLKRELNTGNLTYPPGNAYSKDPRDKRDDRIGQIQSRILELEKQHTEIWKEIFLYWD